MVSLNNYVVATLLGRTRGLSTAEGARPALITALLPSTPVAWLVGNELVRRAAADKQAALAEPSRTPADQQVVVPNLKGETEDDAKEQLARIGLTALSAQHVQADNVERGKVVAQNPGPDTVVARGTTVSIYLSLGAAVPDVRGMMKQEALNELRGAGWGVQIEEMPSDDKDEGRVIDQQPEPGAYPSSDGVPLIVLRVGVGKTVLVPMLIGKTAADAKKELLGTTLVATVDGTAAAPADDAIVVEQHPESGKQVAKRSAVRLRFSSPLR